jgi:transcriptional regulator with XRE-family HTH domain
VPHDNEPGPPAPALPAWRDEAEFETRKLKRTELARIFGVSSAAVTYWLRGLKLGEDASEAKPIPEDLGRLMVRWIRWIETGQEPTPDELAALPLRFSDASVSDDRNSMGGRGRPVGLKLGSRIRGNWVREAISLRCALCEVEPRLFFRS